MSEYVHWQALIVFISDDIGIPTEINQKHHFLLIPDSIRKKVHLTELNTGATGIPLTLCLLSYCVVLFTTSLKVTQQHKLLCSAW